jgi:hypothetical protein
VVEYLPGKHMLSVQTPLQPKKKKKEEEEEKLI